MSLYWIFLSSRVKSKSQLIEKFFFKINYLPTHRSSIPSLWTATPWMLFNKANLLNSELTIKSFLICTIKWKLTKNSKSMKIKSRISKLIKISSKHKKLHSILVVLEEVWRKNLKISQLKGIHGMLLVEIKWQDFQIISKVNRFQQVHPKK